MKKYLFLILVLVVTGCGTARESVAVKDPVDAQVVQAEKFYEVIGDVYQNNKFDFKLKLLPNYRVEYLPDGYGVSMKRSAEGGMCLDEKKKEYKCNYNVEISVIVTLNLLKFKSLTDFISQSYKDYTPEFVDYNGAEGVIVDVPDKEIAIRHFYVMSSGNSIILEAYLKLPSKYFGRHAEGFNEFTKTIELF